MTTNVYCCEKETSESDKINRVYMLLRGRGENVSHTKSSVLAAMR